MTVTAPSVLWFRRDLRLLDHPALAAAAAGGPVLGLFVLDPTLIGPAGSPRREFLLGCLRDLNEQLGGRLLMLAGDPVTLVPQVASSIGARDVHITADHGPYGRQRDGAVARALAAGRAELVATGSPYAISPGRVHKPGGGSYAMFTPFHRVWAELPRRGPVGEVDVDWLPSPVASLDPAAVLGGGAPGSARLPQPGEQAARRRWADFLDDGLDGYDTDRDRPDLDASSRISPYLKWGCLHPRTLLADLDGLTGSGPRSFRRELAWREFYADLVHHRPESTRRSVDPVIDTLQWDSGPAAEERFRAWQQGRTGYPFIDAGMRQLLAEGWMHNRVRMAVASFLIKDLHLPWQRGARHFMNHLVDGDVASNAHGWQWAAGAGPQASPFFRVFHPVTQGQRHDPAGSYVRRYVPELRGVPGRAVHTPWELPAGPPDGYPLPLLDHAEERQEALRRYAARERR